ncbi:MAG: hypothetical protein KIS95_03600 [Anaerolineae bacterium]|uniref:hypothetical protein n=1 Tax=Promineifilum sp. TaxID=2664178 RepID=UPI001DF397C6|nr:hypothetical protein [Anaerolineales bacterium]MCO5181430.1 hypothetical protein [Promineifilum sp.]MCW5846290.1 hypothetical protein [Anaerolineae bacterium]
MSTKRSTPFIVLAIAAVVVLAAVLLGGRLLNGDDSLLRTVVVRDSLITPNADGVADATPISYELSRNATVSIYFEDAAGDRFFFRQDKARGAGQYEVLFSGVVDGYRLATDEIAGEILSRLLRDGDYTWTIEATDFDGVTERQQGTITIADADPQLPELRNFTLDRHTFTPNRDGIDDRVLMQFYLPKEVADVRVFVQLPEGGELPIAEQERDVPANSPGRHYYDYEGGVDNGETPPPDGVYTVVAQAQDAEGQRIRVTDELTIQHGGVPRADIFPPPTGNSVQWSATAVALCDTITFTMTVENYGNAPIRTTGPEPGIVYDSDWNYNTLGWFTESGAWRAAIGFENEITNYPYRWALGSASELEEIDGHLYLMPGQRAVITGGIRVTGVFGNRNPQPLWAGLIHEDVQITEFNNRVDPQSILVDVPDAAHRPECEPREIPIRVLDPAAN